MRTTLATRKKQTFSTKSNQIESKTKRKKRTMTRYHLPKPKQSKQKLNFKIPKSEDQCDVIITAYA